MSTVTIVPTGTANLASIAAAFDRLGWESRLSDDPDVVRTAGRLVVPGVGTFGAAMGQIDRSMLSDTIAKRIANDEPTLAICVGFQVLARSSDESPGVEGIGAIDDTVGRFSDAIQVPQLGWNEVSAPPEARFLRSGWAYFANSYRIQSPPAGWISSLSDHGSPFVAAIERGATLGCQFHPELSGPWGAEVLRRWLNQEMEVS